MKRHFLILCVLVLTAQFSWGGSVTPPANLPAYYSTYINNKSASTLFTGIHDVAKVGYSSLSYNGLWTAYATTDVYPAGHAQAGNIWDMYGGCTFIYSSNQCGGYSKECDCYNREHSIPKSWFGSSESANTPGTDIFHVVPTDGKVNGMRSNYAFGEVTSASYSYNGSKLGTPNSITIANSILGEAETTKLCSSSSVFEPIDEYKGDFARGYLGAMVRWASGDYQTFTSGDGGQIFNTAYDASHYYGLTQYGVALLLKWHRQDPVSQKEIDRNNGIQTTQGNRNPFIDYPILAEYLWGKYAGQTFSTDNAVGSFEAGFTPGVSDGDKGSPVSYSVSWMADGTQVSTSSTRPNDPDNCSDSRVFRGWTGTANYSGSTAPEDLFTSGDPTITSDTTFYAVYADKSTSGSGSGVITSFGASDFTGQGSTPNGGSISATKDGVTFACDKGYGTTEVRCYKNGVVTISSSNTITKLKFTFSGSYTGGLDTVYADLSTTEWSAILESQARFTSIQVTAGGTATTYSNFNLSCAESGGCASETGFDPSYYASTEGLKDSLLKSALGALTFEHYTTRYSYGSGKNKTWHAFWATDRNTADNSVIDMYSNNKRYFNPSDTTASVTDCDIEHMFPNSWFGGENGNKHAYCDLHHLVPADYSANRSKGNRGPGIPTDSTWTNGVWVNGNDANRDNLSVFCPPDEYKGDFARAFFYIATTYGDTATWQTDNSIPHMTNSDWHEFLSETRDLLLSWHRNDPVSDKERVRMNKVYQLQGNRNPFIDYPCLAEYIWGTQQGEAFTLNGSTPTPTPVETKYTITWSVNGSTSSNQVTENTQPTAPSVSDCSETRVFKGWTTTSTVGSDAPTPLYAAADIPNATAAATYYAVYADKETSGGSSIESVTFSSRYTVDTEVENTALSIGSNTSVTFVKGSTASKYYSNGSAIRWYGGGTCTITSTAGNITKIVFTYGSNDGTNAITSDVGTFETDTWTGNASTVVFTQGGTSGQRRIADISVTITTASVTTYSNYGLLCSAAPTPEYTVTFISEGEQVTAITGEAGEEIQVSDPTSACNNYSFYGWSTSQYATDNTDEPSVSTPTTIPAEDVTYYAVYTTSEEGADIPTNNYRKITTTSDLTNANYLIVADTSKLVAMRSVLSGYYPIGVEVTANDNVINTEDNTIVWQITLNNTQLTFYNTENGYLYIEKNNSYYNIKFSNNATDNQFTYSVTDGAWIITSVKHTDRQIEYYRPQARWTFYTSQNAPIYLYKQVIDKETTTYYTTVPSCSSGPATGVEAQKITNAPQRILMGGHIFILRDGKMYNLQGIRVQ